MTGLPFLTLIFSLLLLLSALLSERADRTFLSLPLIFLFGGISLGLLFPQGAGEKNEWLGILSDAALLSVLFTDGTLSGYQKIKSVAGVTALALCLGMPLTIGFIGSMVHFVLDLPWIEGLLVGAVLCPTDPVFAAGLVGKEKVPARLRQMLNSESGLNDALALPAVLGLLLLIGPGGKELNLFRNIGGGLAIGIMIPWLAVRLKRLDVFHFTELYGRLFDLSIFLLVLSSTHLMGGNTFLAVFLAGATLATLEPKLAKNFHEIGLPLTEILKLLAVYLFGYSISPHFFSLMEPELLLAAFLILFFARPLAFYLVLFRSQFEQREKITIAWFGPRGFASVIFALLVLRSHVPDRSTLFHIMILTITGSIIVHSTTDVLFLRWLLHGRFFPFRKGD